MAYKKIVGIYKITSPIDEVYIGQSHNIRGRMSKFQGKGLSQLVRLNSSVIQYGWDNHKKDTLHELPTDVSQEVLDAYEILYMQAYRDCGIKLLNIREGGRHGKLGEETLLKLKGKQTMLGKHHSKETKDKIRLTKFGCLTPYLYKKVICSETGTIYPSIKDASVKLGIPYRGLVQQLLGYYKNKTTLNYLEK